MTIDLVIPTMWAARTFVDALNTYCLTESVNSIIIVDNNRAARPDSQILLNPKIQIIDYGRNIYVNPAWNEGVAKATSDIVGLINDDICVEAEVFDLVLEQDFSKIGLLGVDLRGAHDNYTIGRRDYLKDTITPLNYKKSDPIGGQAWAFGICMFVRRDRYIPIPSLYQVWYGDDYLAQHVGNIYTLSTNRITGKISETLVKHNSPRSDIARRIQLDSKNLIRFGHFENGHKWDLPHNMISQYEEEKSHENLFEREYQRAKSTPSDINENLHLLYEISKECSTVIEFGVRTGVSTRAFLNTDATLISYDIVLNPEVSRLFELAQSRGKDVQYIQANVLDIEIPQCDLLFIDTLHTYPQLAEELALHSSRVNKYIAFHDTHTFGLRGETGKDDRGLLTAIIEFLIQHPEWKFKVHKANNNGLTILEKT